jgi:hypothetical protein
MSEEKKYTFTPEYISIDQLHPHPRNYQKHPDDEIAHIIESIKQHGLYRNIVIAQDNTILAGHGVWEAAHRLGYLTVPVIRLPYARYDPYALKVLIGDNEIEHLAEVDDRILTELLKDLKDLDELLGTGYDEMMLANLVMVTRPTSEIADLDAAAQWVGMPEYEIGPGAIQVIVNFTNEDNRTEFFRQLHIHVPEGRKSIWWPERTRDDVQALRFTTRERENHD